MSNQNYLKTDKEAIIKLKTLIASGEEDNIKLALTLFEHGGKPEVLFTHLFALESTHTNDEIRQSATQLLDAFNNQAMNEVRKANTFFNPFAYYEEKDVNQQLENTIEQPLINTAVFANLFLKFTGKGGLFCLSYKTDVIQAILSEIYRHQNGNMDLRDFQLEELPPEIGLFTNIQYLNIGNNLLTEIPDEIGNITGLKSIDFENTPLSNNALQKLEKFFPEPMAGIYAIQAREASDRFEFDIAIGHMNKALALAPTNANHLNDQGYHYLCLRKLDQAMNYFEIALKEGIEPDIGLYNVACVYAQRKNKPLMLAYLEEVLKLDKHIGDDVIQDVDFEYFWHDEDLLALINKESINNG